MHMKKILAFLCALTCMFGLCACGSEKVYTEIESAKLEQCKLIAVLDINLAMSEAASQESVDYYTSNFDKAELASIYEQAFYSYFAETYGITNTAELGAFNGLLTTFLQASTEMGGLVDIGEATAEIVGKEIIVTYTLKGNKCDGVFKFTFTNDIFTKLVEAEATAKTTFAMKMKQAGANMGNAGLNTLLGMGTVFLMLIVISLIISCFEFIKKPSKQTAPAAPVAVAAPSDEEELVDDTELVAVIMAAICAYEGTGSADGFVVRSIKKANRRK